MSFRELSMIEIREVLRRWSAGQAVRAVGRETGVDRKTVDRYVTAARELDAVVGVEPSDDVVAKVSQRVQATVFLSLQRARGLKRASTLSRRRDLG
jgi:hypothetical protein